MNRVLFHLARHVPIVFSCVQSLHFTLAYSLMLYTTVMIVLKLWSIFQSLNSPTLMIFEYAYASGKAP